MERQKQYDKGYDDAVASTLQVIAIATETYPRVPSADTLKLFMDPPKALLILEAIVRFQDKFATEFSNRIAEEATA